LRVNKPTLLIIDFGPFFDSPAFPLYGEKIPLFVEKNPLFCALGELR